MQEETLLTSTSSESGYLPVSTYPNFDWQSDDKNSESAAVVSNALLAGGELLQTVQVVVCGKDGVQCQARILMDSASH